MIVVGNGKCTKIDHVLLGAKVNNYFYLFHFLFRTGGFFMFTGLHLYLHLTFTVNIYS